METVSSVAVLEPSTNPWAGTATEPRVWIDCTDTFVTRTYTGIQRVVRNLAHFGRQAGAGCMPVVKAGRHWFMVDCDWQPRSTVHSAEFDATNPWARWSKSLKDFGRKSAQRMRKSLVPRKVATAAIDLTRRALWSHRHEAVTFRAGDILLLPDSTWNHLQPPDYSRLRAEGVKVALCLNDILPVTHPQFFTPGAAAAFQRWFASTVPQVDFFLAISRTVRDDLREHVLSNFPQAGFQPDCFEWYPLGVALDQSCTTERIRQEVIAAFEMPNTDASANPASRRGPYLMVSTLEPRKNHATLLDAFEQVWLRHPEARLCIVGAQGWKVQDFVTRIRSHPRWQKQLFWFHNLNDTELAYAYAHSRAFVFPSFAEGYGLPIVEALQHGLPVLASDTRIHREVAGEFARYFSPTEASQLAELIDGLESNRPMSHVRDSAEYRPMEWGQSTQVLLEKCRKLARIVDSQVTGRSVPRVRRGRLANPQHVEAEVGSSSSAR